MSNQERALEVFMEKNTAIAAKLETLTEYFENHMGVSPDEVGWGNAGNAGHVLELLDRVTEFLNLK